MLIYCLSKKDVEPLTQQGHVVLTEAHEEVIARCDAIVYRSSEADLEMVEFLASCHRCPVFYDLDNPDYQLPEYSSEKAYPEQTQSFLGVLMEMYRTYLAKNSDYSPANILATGEIGLVTRLWDKMARLLSLSGFEFTVAESRYSAPKQPKNEAIEDTLLDMAVYAIIGILLRKGQWGK